MFSIASASPHVYPEHDTGMFGSQIFSFLMDMPMCSALLIVTLSNFHFASAINWEDTCGELPSHSPFEKGNWTPRSHIWLPQQRWSLAALASDFCSPGFSIDSDLEFGWNPEAFKKLGLSVLHILRHIELPKTAKSERFQETKLCTP